MDVSVLTRRTSHHMLWVLAALIPGTIAMTLFWGPGVVWNLAWLTAACVLCEAICLLPRKSRVPRMPRKSGPTGTWQQLRFHLGDASVLVTGWLIALALPPYTGLYYLCLAAIGAVGLGKHAFGGLGHNLFNPAMVGYAIVLASFPGAIDYWPAITEQATDALTGATQLSEFRFRDGLTSEEFAQQTTSLQGHQLLSQTWIAASFALGGALLCYLRIAAWRVPLGIFLGVAVGALFGYDQGSSESHGGWYFHLTSGGLMLAAFFVATDPVTHPREPSHQVMFGVLIGALVYCIRAYGVYPDGIAFAVLLANAATPLLNILALGKTATNTAESASEADGADEADDPTPDKAP